MISKKIVWQGTRFNTTEMASVTEAEEYRVKGTIIGELEGNPLVVHYELVIDRDWFTRSVLIQAESDTSFEIFMENKNGVWYDKNGSHLPGLEKAIDIDISLTPFTNSLPINRLRLNKGSSEEITVLYFNLPRQEWKAVKQRYTNLGNQFYKYENLESGFSSVIQTDPTGYVIDYPGIWTMVYPLNNKSRVKEEFASALHSEKISKEIPDTDDLYGWLVGTWDMEVYDYLPGGEKIKSEGEWLFTRVMEGRAIQDLFIVPRRSLRSDGIPKKGNRYGTSLRTFDQENKVWKIHWHNPVNGAFNELFGKQVKGDIVQTGVDSKGNSIRWIFTDIKYDSFRWYGERSTDNGHTWIKEVEFFGKKNL